MATFFNVLCVFIVNLFYSKINAFHFASATFTCDFIVALESSERNFTTMVGC